MKKISPWLSGLFYFLIGFSLANITISILGILNNVTLSHYLSTSIELTFLFLIFYTLIVFIDKMTNSEEINYFRTSDLRRGAEIFIDKKFDNYSLKKEASDDLYIAIVDGKIFTLQIPSKEASLVSGWYVWTGKSFQKVTQTSTGDAT